MPQLQKKLRALTRDTVLRRQPPPPSLAVIDLSNCDPVEIDAGFRQIEQFFQTVADDAEAAIKRFEPEPEKR